MAHLPNNVGTPNFELTLSLCGHEEKPGSQEFNNPWLAIQAIMPAPQCKFEIIVDHYPKLKIIVDTFTQY